MRAPVGFALFRSIGALGFELWLTALAREWRGRGFGRAMVLEALATPVGRVAHLVRVNREGTHAQVMRRLLDSVEYAAIRDTPVAHWFVRRDAPAAVMQYFRTAGITCREPV
jgi:GNAT superfamily N-acetyltransferase